MPQSNRTIRYFTVTKAQFTNDFALPETPIAWASDGRGTDGYVITRRPDAIGASPAPGVTQVIQRFILTPFADLKPIYFPNLPASIFLKATISFTTTDVVIDLNLEER